MSVSREEIKLPERGFDKAWENFNQQAIAITPSKAAKGSAAGIL